MMQRGMKRSWGRHKVSAGVRMETGGVEGNWCLEMNEAACRIMDREAGVQWKTVEEGHSLASGICHHVCTLHLCVCVCVDHKSML